jgi:hypothetical protein
MEEPEQKPWDWEEQLPGYAVQAHRLSRALPKTWTCL